MRPGAAGFTAASAEAMEQLCSEESGERLVAGMLEETAGSAGGSAAVLAHHWREAGDSERAVDYLLKAAERARVRAGREAETVASTTRRWS